MNIFITNQPVMKQNALIGEPLGKKIFNYGYTLLFVVLGSRKIRGISWHLLQMSPCINVDDQLAQE